MPVILIVALAGSLLIHGAALFGTDVELFGGGQELPVLQAELQPPPPPPPPPATPAPVAKPPARPKPVPRPPPPAVPEQVVPSTVDEAPAAAPDHAVPPELPPEVASPPPIQPPPVTPALPANGVIRFAIIKESLGFQVGRAEHRWEFTDDGRYRLVATTETSGLAALFRPVRMRLESRGRLVAGGLQPERFRSIKNDRGDGEGADFDWPARQIRLTRDGKLRPLTPGAQDILSLNYQLAYLGRLAEGTSLGVATARKFERHALDSLGEEDIEVPAGRFRTLHLRALTDSVTEIWIALDHHHLPVKIRFTDKKGESFEQVATDLGL